MKKSYKKPLMEIVEMKNQSILCMSGTGATVTDFTSDDSWGDEYDQ